MYTNYSILCKVPLETDKLYYWENIKKIFPILDSFYARCKTTKIISIQHFEKIRWDKKRECNISVSKNAPTGGSRNNWSYENLHKIFNLYLNDMTYHNYAWEGINKPISAPPIDKRGYPFHYSTTIIGSLEKLEHDKNEDWYNRKVDLRFQIPYYFGQFKDCNMLLEFCFRDEYFNDSEMDNLVLETSKICYANSIYKRKNILEKHAFVHTYERIITDRPQDKIFWQKIY